MSRIGKLPVEIPSGVEIRIDGHRVRMKGPKGELEQEFHPTMRLRQEEGRVVVERASDSAAQRALHGLTRSLLRNMVVGVKDGFSKTLEINGVGYRANLEGKNVNFQLGYSHPIAFPVPAGIQIEVRDQVRVVVSGCDKQQVGQVAANIRSLRPPDPYKAKGVMYAGEHIRRKAGKAGRA